MRFYGFRASVQKFQDSTKDSEDVYPDQFTSPEMRGRLQDNRPRDTRISGDYGQQVNPEAQYILYLPPGVRLEIGDTLVHVDGRSFEVTMPVNRDDLKGWDVGVQLNTGGGF